MDMWATNKFLAELKVLTNVQHLNLFEEALGKPDPKEELKKLVDPRLNQDYPLYSVLAMALLAKCCTQENPHQRPSMRQILVLLMTLLSVTEDRNMGSFFCKFI
ncbi:hypothetical protein ZIOFF_031036 [Zingiber officinale]|uniref:Uncharacterized protein n=1 Tax=Zingiber officinale TaxID=94328 RepID=A0A8J5GQB1_ZINOF|nr:hypothetical protein ZIOFF_031036 [Zingiber officinale]